MSSLMMQLLSKHTGLEAEHREACAPYGRAHHTVRGTLHMTLKDSLQRPAIAGLQSKLPDMASLQ